MPIIDTRFRLRRDTAANWASVNPVPLDGEPCIETDTRLRKIGDGETHYNDLLYIISGEFDALDEIEDGQVPVWDAANKRWKAGAGGGGGATWGGIGGTLSDQTDLQEALDSLGLVLSGRVATHGDLPTALGTGDDGKAYLVDADQLIYVWNGTSFPANGDGLSLGGSSASIPADTATVARLNFHPAKFDRYFRPSSAYRTDHGSSWTSVAEPVLSSDGLGMDFEGTNGFKFVAGFAGSTQVPVGTLATIDAWIRLSSSFSAQGYIFGNRNGSTAGFAVRIESNRKVICFDTGGASATSTTVLALDTPVFLRAIATATQWQVFANGTQILSFTRTSYNAGTNFELGRQSSSNAGTEYSFNGVIYSMQMRVGVNKDGSVVPDSYDLV